MINQDQVKSVSLWETLVSKARNFSFKGLKLEFQSLETNRFTKGNTLFLGEKRSVSNRVETNYEIVLLILLNYVIRKQQSN